ncbi:MAG TPA: hypothetical protein VFU43_27890 [Streptosporangiaceae bacterium]|nr:hypothetical protein [Streptosporangiaceae bacterium]
MTFRSRFRSDPPRPASAGAPAEGDWAWPLAFADRACCCAAKPVVVAVMPPTAARPYPMDLLLCAHHHRLARAALAAADAVVYDETGARIQAAIMDDGQSPPLPPGGREPAEDRRG